MAERRTFKQKQKAKLRLTHDLYTLPASGTSLVTDAPKVAAVPASTPSARDIFGYEPQLLLQDVMKTLITSLVIVGALLALMFSGRFG